MRGKMLAEARESDICQRHHQSGHRCVQGIVCGGAFAIVGLNSSLFWGVVMHFLRFFPW